MEWDHKQGDDLNDLLRAAQTAGPNGDASRETLEDRPKLTPYEAYFERVFRLVSRSRSFGMAPGPIDPRIIWRYAERNGLSRMRADILERVILNVDDVYMNLMAERSKKASEGSTPK